MDKFVSFVGIAQVAAAAHQKSTDVVEGVVAQTMPVGTDEFEQMRVFPHVVTHHEEGGFDTIAVERLDEPWGRFGDGSVVEGQIDCLLRRIHSPDGAGIEPTQPFGGLFDDHLFIYYLTIYNVQLTFRDAHIALAYIVRCKWSNGALL